MLKFYDVHLKGLLPGLLMSNGQMADGENEYARRHQELVQKSAGGSEIERQIRQVNVTGRLYVNASGQIVIPAAMIESATRKGASAVKRDKGRRWWSGITVQDDAPIICDGLPTWDRLHEDDRFVHRCTARNANGTPAPRYRPYFKTWQAAVPVEIDTDLLDAELLKAIFDATGRSVGFGDWRPSSPKNPGKFGRFQVVKVEERAEELPVAA